MKITMIKLILVALVFTLGCTRGCKKEDKTIPPKVDAATETAPSVNPAGTNKMTTETENLTREFNLQAGDKLFATLHTSVGDIKIELFWDKTPRTVWNFAALATGKQAWTHPATGVKEAKPLYDGTIFHRVIKNFMIQGGDPLGTGTGGPGYNFKDEFVAGLKHDKKGVLSMANAGPNTNGSQFFITEVPTPHLDGRHSVFGQVDAASFSVIDKIANTPTGRQDRPQTDIVIKSVTVTKG